MYIEQIFLCFKTIDDFSLCGAYVGILGYVVGTLLQRYPSVAASRPVSLGVPSFQKIPKLVPLGGIKEVEARASGFKSQSRVLLSCATYSVSKKATEGWRRGKVGLQKQNNRQAQGVAADTIPSASGRGEETSPSISWAAVVDSPASDPSRFLCIKTAPVKSTPACQSVSQSLSQWEIVSRLQTPKTKPAQELIVGGEPARG